MSEVETRNNQGRIKYCCYTTEKSCNQLEPVGYKLQINISHWLPFAPNCSHVSHSLRCHVPVFYCNILLYKFLMQSLKSQKRKNNGNMGKRTVIVGAVEDNWHYYCCMNDIYWVGFLIERSVIIYPFLINFYLVFSQF